MRVEVKVCGLTRASDARDAAALGARYVGAIFAGGPRTLEPEQARLVLDGAGIEPNRVGVFASADVDAIAATVDAAKLDIVQLHADPSPSIVEAIRDACGAQIWAVVRVDQPLAADELRGLWETADALVLDSKVKGMLGGSGVSFDWYASEPATRSRRGRLIVAGGLTSTNVGEAIRALSPDVVDVSSGVESAPGIKDRSRMAAFIEAAAQVEVLR